MGRAKDRPRGLNEKRPIYIEFVLQGNVVKVTAIHTQSGEQPRRLGFMRGVLQVPDDFDRMGGDDIASMFAGGGA